MKHGRVAVVGGGIAGLAAAWEFASATPLDVTVFETSERLGGRIGGTAFAGLDTIDSGADAFLARVPDATELAAEVGLADELTSPEPVHAAVWYDGLHRIPDGLLLGVPGHLAPLATTRLLSWRGKARAALEPLLPRTSIDADSIGRLVRARFGDEVQERLVDALVGSIYATDTDRFSLREVPQLYELASSERSLLLAARRRGGSGTGTAASGPIFAAPRGGLAQLVAATADAVAGAGGSIRTSAPVDRIEAERRWVGWSVASRSTPSSSPRPPGARPHSSPTARPRAVTCSAAPRPPTSSWSPSTYRPTSGPSGCTASAATSCRSPCSVRSPRCRSVRRSGRTGGHRTAGRSCACRWVATARHRSTAATRSSLDAVLDDLAIHLGTRFAPLALRITRWPGAFAQYRPHHRDWVDAVERSLPPGLFVAGSSYRGIGIPACIRDGRTVARRATADVTGLSD